MKRIIYFCLLCSVAITIAAQVPSAFAGARQDIRFQRGASSATIQQTVIRGERDRYTLGVGKGQYLSVRIESLEDNAVFDVYLPGANDSDENDIKGIPLQGAVEKKSFSSELPANGKYLIVVGGTRGNAEYKLTVSVTNTPPRQEMVATPTTMERAPVESQKVLPSVPFGLRCTHKKSVLQTYIYLPDGTYLQLEFLPSDGKAYPVAEIVGRYSSTNDTYIHRPVARRPLEDVAKLTNQRYIWTPSTNSIELTIQYSNSREGIHQQLVKRVIDGKNEQVVEEPSRCAIFVDGSINEQAMKSRHSVPASFFQGK